MAWEGEIARIELTLPRDHGIELEMTLESGEPWRFSHASLAADPWKPIDVHGLHLDRRVLPIEGLPSGYHRLEVRSGTADGTALVICAPKRCPRIDGSPWGGFLPLYAVRSRRNWGCGDFTDLADLCSWVASLGGSTMGTLPLLPTFLHDPSPYSPVSRLFWNELFIDVERVPELERSAAARELLASPGFAREIGRLRRTRSVDYRAVGELKRRALELLARAFHDGPATARRRGLGSHAHEYARFRAACERHGGGWPHWPRRGRITVRDVDEEVVRYHQYVQGVAEEQLSAASRDSRLYLDLPLGVNLGGFDTWKYRGAFAHGASGGAPPDVFFTEGQDWGFPPPHPEGIRADGYAYFRAALRHHLRHAGVLRVDHVMGLHRLYWVLPGMDARSGVYVRYRADELYAILALESHRAGAAIVGEDLGTVPTYVRPAMGRHGIMRSYVLELEALLRPLRDPVRDSVASLNTHDLPTFAGFWEGPDVDVRLRRELSAALRERGLLRRPGTAAALRAALRFLAASRARMVMVNLEDLWQERQPQNRPGTGPERHNWQRKARRTIEALRMDRQIAGTLGEIHLLRGDHP